MYNHAYKRFVKCSLLSEGARNVKVMWRAGHQTVVCILHTVSCRGVLSGPMIRQLAAVSCLSDPSNERHSSILNLSH